MVKAVIISYRRGRHTQNPRQYLIAIDGVDSKAKASQFIGKKVIWKNIVGRITAVHGRKGIVRAKFRKGLPSIPIEVEIE
jgi:large subunit ribosomal protein L35Ae